MVVCELCGIKTDQNLNKIKVAGSFMMVCNNCKNHGKSFENHSDKSYSFKRNVSNKIEYEVVQNYAQIINNNLKKHNINFHQLAKKLNIKESSITKYIAGKIKPDIDTAKKIEKYFNIRLVEEINNNENFEDPYLEVKNLIEKENLGEITLGDLLKKELDKK